MAGKFLKSFQVSIIREKTRAFATLNKLQDFSTCRSIKQGNERLCTKFPKIYAPKQISQQLVFIFLQEDKCNRCKTNRLLV